MWQQIGILIVVDSGVLYHIGRDEQKGNVNRLCNVVEIMNNIVGWEKSKVESKQDVLLFRKWVGEYLE